VAKKEMLSKLKMPAPASKKDPMLDVEAIDLDEVGAPEDMEEAEPLEGKETAGEEAAELSALDDEALIAELKKRGYEVESEKEEGEQGPEEMDMGFAADEEEPA
jgi:hypothetical protein